MGASIIRWNHQTFDTYVETQLAPTLRRGDVVILENLASHKSAKAEAILVAAWRAGLSFCCPTDPDLNLIEIAFAKPKAHLRRSSAPGPSTPMEGHSAPSGLSTPTTSAGTFSTKQAPA